MIETSDNAPFTKTLIAGRYQVEKNMGAGMMGRVYLCKDAFLDEEPVALKMLFRDLCDDPTYVARFRREVQLARQLGHPHIVRVHDYGVTAEGEHFFTMEVLTGGSLAKLLREGPLSFEKTIDLFTKIVSAVAYAHGQAIVHRDLKPDNMLFSADGVLKVADFGTARGALADRQNLTRTGDSLGTPLYMAPEIIQGGRGDKHSDLYSLGILAHELVAGKPPFLAQTWASLAALHVTHPAPEISSEKAPLWYREMVLRLLEKNPARRFATADEVLDLIHSFTQQAQNGARIPFLPVASAGCAGVVAGAIASYLLL